MSLDLRRIISVAAKSKISGENIPLTSWLKPRSQLPAKSSYRIIEEDPDLFITQKEEDSDRFVKIITLKVGEEKSNSLTVKDLAHKKKSVFKIKEQFSIQLPSLEINNLSTQDIPSVSSKTIKQNLKTYQVGEIKDEKIKSSFKKVSYLGRANIYGVKVPGVYDEENDLFEGSYLKFSGFDENHQPTLEQYVLLPEGDFALRLASDLSPGKLEIEVFAGIDREAGYPSFSTDFYLRRIIRDS